MYLTPFNRIVNRVGNGISKLMIVQHKTKKKDWKNYDHLEDQSHNL